MKRKRLTAVRLTEIPFLERMAAARREAHATPDEQERVALFAAAMFPSDKVYYVASDERFLDAAA